MPRHAVRKGRRRRSRPQRGRKDAGQHVRFEAEVLPGLAPFVGDVLATVPGVRIAPTGASPERADAVTIDVAGGVMLPETVLRMVTALHRVVHFDVPRPKALLADAHLRTLRHVLEAVLREAEAHGQAFHAVRLDAAGRTSPVMLRLAEAASEAVHRPVDAEHGDLKVRVRPARNASDGGWEVLVRTTPRPLSARSWRVANLPGGLNACVAAAAWHMVGARDGECVVNLACGSGTLLVERAAVGPSARLVGIDVDEAALAAARANLTAAGVKADLLREDATATSLPDASCDVMVSDPPWGDVHGGDVDLSVLYGALLDEAARLVAPGGQALVIVHALRAFEAAWVSRGDAWCRERSLRVFHGGHRPALHHLRRTASPDRPLLHSRA